jgi:hypothetical protein
MRRVKGGEQDRRQAQTGREAEGRLRRELTDAMVTSMHEAWLRKLKHAASYADIDAINARWAAGVRRAKREARQLAGELSAEQVRARIGRGRDAAYQAAWYVPASCCGGRWRVAMARFEIPEGWSVQAFCFALDPSPEQAACLRRQFGGRRHARNWAVRTLKADLDRHRETGEQTAAPSLAGLRKRWNQVKDAECVDAETGLVWWPHVSKEAFADGIKAAVDGYWAWQASLAGTRAGRRAGFPRFAKKGRDRDRVTFTTGAIRVEPDRRHVTLPRIGTVRVHENTRRLQRLLAKGTARILAVTVSRKGTRLIAAFRVLIQRPLQPRVALPGSRVGVDVGVRVLATVASPDGEVIERAPNPRPLERALSELRHLSRERSRRIRGSRRFRAAVKRRADYKTRPGRAGGDETRKGPGRQAGKQPRDGAPAR